MKNKILLLAFSLIALISVSQAQTSRVKWKQLETGSPGQIAVVGVDGNGKWVTPVFLSWSDTTNYIATKTDVKNAAGNEVTSGTFSGGNLNLNKKTGAPVVIGLDGRYVPLSEKAAANGVATLGADGKVPSAQLPAQNVSDVYVVSSQAAMLALGATQGDFAVRTDASKTFVLQQAPATTLSNWVELPTGAGITSVNGQAGPAVTLTTDNISEGATNKYFSQSLARSAIGASGALAYNQTTGVVTHNTSAITPNTAYNNIQFDQYGHAISGSNVAYLQAADLANYYTKTQLQTAGQATVDWNNIANKPGTLGANEVKNEFTSSTSSSLTLTNTPKFPAAIQLFLNGVLLAASDYSISGTTITLGFARESSDLITAKYAY